MMALFTNKRDCYGCGACASVCPRGAIKMVHDKHGFLYPVIPRVANRAGRGNLPAPA